MKPIISSLAHSLTRRAKSALVLAYVAAFIIRNETAAETTEPSNAVRQPPSYGLLISTARKALDSGEISDALVSAMAAISLDDKRFEAYALGATIKMRQGDFTSAARLLNDAQTRAPAEKQAGLIELAKLIQKESKVAPAHAATLPTDLQRKFDVLKDILAEADRTIEKENRNKLLQEFMDRSADVASQLADFTPLWILRGLVALELQLPQVGWEAGKKLLEQQLKNPDDPKLRQVLAKLDRVGWLTEKSPKEISLEHEKAAREKLVGIDRVLAPMADDKLRASVPFVTPGRFKPRRGRGEIRFKSNGGELTVEGSYTLDNQPTFEFRRAIPFLAVLAVPGAPARDDSPQRIIDKSGVFLLLEGEIRDGGQAGIRSYRVAQRPSENPNQHQILISEPTKFMFNWTSMELPAEAYQNGAITLEFDR